MDFCCCCFFAAAAASGGLAISRVFQSYQRQLNSSLRFAFNRIHRLIWIRNFVDKKWAKLWLWCLDEQSVSLLWNVFILLQSSMPSSIQYPWKHCAHFSPLSPLVVWVTRNDSFQTLRSVFNHFAFKIDFFSYWQIEHQILNSTLDINFNGNAAVAVSDSSGNFHIVESTTPHSTNLNIENGNRVCTWRCIA